MKVSKLSRLRKFLEGGRSITPRQAVSKWDMWRLSDSCFKLRKLGMNIRTEIVRNKKSVHAKYSLVKS